MTCLLIYYRKALASLLARGDHPTNPLFVAVHLCRLRSKGTARAWEPYCLQEVILFPNLAPNRVLKGASRLEQEQHCIVLHVLSVSQQRQ